MRKLKRKHQQFLKSQQTRYYMTLEAYRCFFLISKSREWTVKNALKSYGGM